jgi:hypothetical protein
MSFGTLVGIAIAVPQAVAGNSERRLADIAVGTAEAFAVALAVCNTAAVAVLGIGSSTEAVQLSWCLRTPLAECCMCIGEFEYKSSHRFVVWHE